MLWVRDRGCCAICLNPVSPDGGSNVDHVVPLTRGGSNHPINLGLTHVGCNKAKLDRIVDVPRLACAVTLFRIMNNGASPIGDVVSVRSLPNVPKNHYPKVRRP